MKARQQSRIIWRWPAVYGIAGLTSAILYQIIFSPPDDGSDIIGAIAAELVIFGALPSG